MEQKKLRIQERVKDGAKMVADVLILGQPK